MLGIVGYGGAVVRDDEEGSGESAGEGERDRGRGMSAGADGGGVGETAAIITAFDALRLVELVALGGCLGAGFCLPLWGAGEGGPESPERSTALGIPVCGPLRFRIDEKCSQSWYLGI